MPQPPNSTLSSVLIEVSEKSAPVRLASSGTPCGVLYNTYQLALQVTALYAKAERRETREDFLREWSRISESAMDSIGFFVKLWEATNATNQTKATALDTEGVFKRTATMCRRNEACEARMSLWTPVSRQLRISLSADKALDRLLDSFAKFDPTLKPVLLPAKDASARRLGVATALLHRYHADAAALRENYAEPISLARVS